jgi:hypothetical protein
LSPVGHQGVPLVQRYEMAAQEAHLTQNLISVLTHLYDCPELTEPEHKSADGK